MKQLHINVYVYLFSDINECEDDHGCSQICINKIGTFTCECNDGYILQADGKQCLGTQVS